VKRNSKIDIFKNDFHELSEQILRCASLSTTTGSMMTTKYDDKNFEISKWKLQLGNVQKNPYKIMNIMYTTSTCTNGESDKLFHDTKRDILSSCTDFPTARYTETEIKEVMNYLLYVFISSVCMHTCM
jgi:hypothetical protein